MNGQTLPPFVYMGYCICGVSAGKRKGKKNPTPDDTCMRFKERR